MSETSELASKLAHRTAVNEGEKAPKMVARTNIYTEFPELSRKQIKEYEKKFQCYDEDGNGVIDMNELTHMMEKLGAPQTYISLKAMIAEVDEDGDNAINFREFLLIFKKAAAGELIATGLTRLAELSEVDVSEVGVGGAANFFEDKIRRQSEDNSFLGEIKKEQEEKRLELIEKAKRKQAFMDKASAFKTT